MNAKTKMEQIDFFDDSFNYVGHTSIDEIHQKGLWHQTFACWLYNPCKKVIYLQLRGPRNRIGANTFDASSSGHLSAGETKENGFRELYEELGVNIDIEQACYLGYFKNIAHLSNYTNNEFCHIYLVPTNNVISDFVFQDGEVSNVFELKIADIDDLFMGQEIEICSQNEKRKITIQNMCIYKERIENGYYKWVFDAIKEQL
ncbi:MAG: NUDIX domain-containing protein [Alphaproteobacteria bacterium]|nr:NUDIX domain-containing protein [Alphaproteobacteria bacterium]